MSLAILKLLLGQVEPLLCIFDFFVRLVFRLSLLTSMFLYFSRLFETHAIGGVGQTEPFIELRGGNPADRQHRLEVVALVRVRNRRRH